MRQGRIESESEIRFFPLGNENDIGSKSQNENPFRILGACAGELKIYFVPLLEMEILFVPRAKVEKENAAGPKLVMLHMRRKSR